MSSGQPYKKPSDVQMYRNEYLNDLEMRKDLDKINYDANMNYIKTGALPPQSQMSDNRTVNDKLLDLVYLKKHIVDTLSPLSSQKYAVNVVEALLSNPNNVDNKLLVFAAQRAPEIAEQLKKIYSIGIKGDLDDSMKLVSYILKMFRVQHNSMLSLREVQNRFTSDKTPQTSLLASLHNIILQIIIYIKNLKNENIFMRDIDGMIDNLTHIAFYIPDNKGDARVIRNNKIERVNINELHEIILNKNNNVSESINIAITRYLAFLNSDFPSLDELNYLYKNIIRSYETWFNDKTPRNTGAKNRAKLTADVRKIYNLIANKDVMNRITDVEQAYADISDRDMNLYNEELRPDLTEEERNKIYNDSWQPQPQPNLSTDNILDSLPGNFTGDLKEAIDYYKLVKVYMMNPTEDTDYMEKSFYQYYGVEYRDFENWVDAIQVKYNIDVDDIINKVGPSKNISPPPPPNASQSEPVPDLEPNNEPEDWNPPNGLTINDAINSYKSGLQKISVSKTPIFGIVAREFERQYNYDYVKFENWYNDNNMGGNGLFKKKRGRGRPRGTGVVKPYKQTISENLNTDKGLEESRRFVKFGKYLINMNKLNDNILSLKIPSGGTVIGHPVTKVTSSFSKIVKNMINNVSPSFKDLQSLSDTEKNYLYNISKKANILDKFSIPTPDMSEDDKDINEYEILKGEILAGNDNKDLIKKFKAKIVKMSNKGLLNKKDVSSILHDLLNLNF
jgi:hypothetical protein